jgi:hypothetical protein
VASILLSTIGSNVGAQLGGPPGAMIGRAVGQMVGGAIDNKMAGAHKRYSEGARLEDLAVQTSTYGRVIPSVYGKARIGGNVIWARPIKELQTTSTTTIRSGGKGGGGGGGGGGTQKTSQTTYSYYSTCAIAICEGVITSVDRVWADAKLLSIGQYTMRIYYGTETQLPDALIESYEGATTAYRGLAYVVFEDFPLAEFGNRVPNFTFEVTRKVAGASAGTLTAEQRVTSVMIIPGSGEHVYDTVVESKTVGETVGGQWVQRGNQVTLNMHNVQNVANVNLALDQLQQTFPNLTYVGLVVNWFINSLDATNAVIEPCVEYPNTSRVIPNEWSVAGLTRNTARVVGVDGAAIRYGGTPSDSGVVRLLQQLKARGLKVMFYPMLQVDAAGKPWRGYISCGASNVASFFTRTKGYNAFILHYASLTKGLVDAFVIGSELRALTSVNAGAGVYPAVTQFISLAASVKQVMGSSTKLTYAADWSEYHHTDGGWYHLDPLWASPDIGMVGIDAYFPLTNAPQNGVDRDAIRAGWTSGEGYDWYYSDSGRTVKAPLGAAYAWKNISWWWKNPHVNPNGVQSAWVPQSKKIWFTEYGFASVDGATNEPNKFVDPTSSDSGYPRFSRARIDFAIQRAAIEVTEEVWANSPMVERKFLWTWDARPYPQWPDLLDIWSDGGNWDTGHWVQGKLGLAQLGGAVRVLLQRAGIDDARIDCAELTDALEGFVIAQRMTIREALEQLMMAYPFDVIETAGILKAIKRGRQVVAEFTRDDCLPVTDGQQRLEIETKRTQELDLPGEIEVVYLNRLNGYNAAAQRAFRAKTPARSKQAYRMALVLSDQQARAIAERQMASRWLERNRFTLQLSIRFASLEPGDVIRCVDAEQSLIMRVDALQFGRPGIVRIEAVEEDSSIYDSYSPHAVTGITPIAPEVLAETKFSVFELPSLPNESEQQAQLLFAATGAGGQWAGATLYQLRASGDTVLAQISTSATLGQSVNALASARAQIIDYANSVDVILLGSTTLASATLADVLEGANSALLGDEVIQFMTATAMDDGKYRLSGLLRGRLGTEASIAIHQAGERFVLLDGNLVSSTLASDQAGKTIQIAAATYGAVVNPDTAISYTPRLRSLIPYAPVHPRAVRKNAGDITLQWVRRTRVNGQWRDYQDVPLSEADERYDVEIINNNSVIRTVRTTTPLFIYNVVDQSNDFGGVQTSVLVRIYQLSALAGRGNMLEVSV